MLWLAALALAANTQQQPQPLAAPVSVQADATVRVISGVVVDLTGQATADAPPVRETSVRIEGAPERVRLVEFQ
jgi:hypothetical protein